MLTRTLNFKYKSLIALLLCCAFLTSNAQEKTKITAVYSTSINGNFATIANNTVSFYRDSDYTGNAGNHDSDLTYVDIDNDFSTFSSSSANFVNPNNRPDPCMTIKKAFLYWVASDKETTSGQDNISYWNFNDIKLMLPSQSTYTTYTADRIIYRGRDDRFQNAPYVCFKDITSIVSSLDDPYGKYQIANVESSTRRIRPYEFYDRFIGSSGGWQIVFVYEKPDLPRRNITIFDGYSHIVGGSYEEKISVKGFKTIPKGKVNADFLFGALEGDQDISGDSFKILDTNGIYQSIGISGIREENNFFSSKITINNIDFTDRKPASTNTLGFDAGLFTLKNSGNKIIDNNQTSASVILKTNEDSYGIFLLGLSIEVYEPNLDPLLLTSNVPDGGTVTPNQIITNSVKFKNRGNDNAINTTLTAEIPPHLSLVEPISGLPNGITYTTTTDNGKTLLTFTVANNLVLSNSQDIQFNYQTKVKDACYILTQNCDLKITPRITANYTGESNGEKLKTKSSYSIDSCGYGSDTAATYTIKPDPAYWVTAAKALDRTVECNDAKALADAQALSPLSNCLGLNPIKTSGSYISGNPKDCKDKGSYTNTWVFTDKCGNTIEEFKQVITIVDNTKPDLTLCGDKINLKLILECGNNTNKTIADSWNSKNLASIKGCAKDNCDTDIKNNITSNYNFTGNETPSCDDSKAITVTYTILDECGNKATIDAQIIYQDTEAPKLDLCKKDVKDITVQCGDDYKSLLDKWNQDNLKAIKNCAKDDCLEIDTNILSNYVYEDIIPAECGDEGGKTPINYTVKDICGNAATLTVYIIVKDTKGPDLTLCNDKLNDITIECGEDYKDKLEQWNTANISKIKTCATDACVTVDANITSNYKFEDITPAECGDDGAKTPVTYTVKDICGNEATITLNIILKDTKGPDLALCNDKLNDITIECGEDYKDKLEQWNTANIKQIKTCATDACVTVDANITSNYKFEDITPAECGDDGAKTPVTYTVKDICGNEATITLNIILKDTKGPDLTLCNDKLNDITIECGEDYKDKLEQWNTANIKQIKTCATDACVTVDANITSNYKFEDITPAECGDDGAKTPVTYTVKDICGNEATITLNIILKDTKGPDLVLCNDKLNDITIECGEDYKDKLEQWNTANIKQIKTCATDACVTVDANITSNYKFEDITPAECGDDGAKTPVTYTVKDICGNEATITLNIILKDTKGPDLALCNDKLNDITIECGEDYKNKLEEWDTSNISKIKTCATDACVTVDTNITSNFNITSIKPVECGKGSSTPVTYTVKDICGNEATVSVNIILKDTTGPDLSACKVLDKNTECTADATEQDAIKWNTENINALKSCAKDDCDPNYKAVVTSDFDFANFKPSDCGNGGTLIVTYFVKDVCDNISEIKGTYASGDSSPPDVSACQLNDIILECGEYTQKDVDDWHENIISTFKTCAVDVCETNFKPIIADDYDFTKIKPAECGDEGAKTPVTFTIKDKCDNATTKVAYIIVKDTKGPDLKLCNDKINDITIECGEDYKNKLENWNTDNITKIKTCATDACVDVDTNISSNYIFEDIKPAECGDDGAKTPVTYTVKDICGNSTTITANIILKDTKGPDLTLCNDKLNDITIECGEDYKDKLEQWNASNISKIKTCATDACVKVDQNIGSNYKFEDITPVDCGSNGALTPITYSVTDICGNKSSVTVNIILKDTKGPDLTLCSKNVKDITIECGEDYKDKLEQWNLYNINEIKACATDSCVAVDQNINSNYKFENIKPAECDASGAITPITYTVKDICGNATTITANIILKDTKGPDLSLCTSIKDLVLECGSDSENIANQWNKANIAAIKTCATDACLTVDTNNIISTYKFNDVAPADCATGSLTPVQYTVSDICGNKTQIKVNIIFKDTTAPIIKSGQTSVNVLCSELPDVPKLEFEDACNNIVKVTKFEEESTKKDTVSNYTIIRKWYVSDECGNNTSYSQTINVQYQNFEFDNDGEHCTDDGEINLFDYAQAHKNLNGQWIFVDGPKGQDIKINNGIFDPKDFKLGEYQFYYTSPQGACYRTTNLKIILNDECIPLPCGLENFTISKALTPNGDVYNEYFEVKGTRECGFKLKLKIFNRWGSIVFKSDDYQNDWNGFSHGSSVGDNGKVPNGTYFYVLDIVNSGIKPISGPIYIGTK